VIVVLTSGVALGVHVPGLLLARRLEERGVEVRVEVFERLLPEAKRRQIGQAKELFHRDVRAALAGQRLTRDLAPILDEVAVRSLETRWHDTAIDTFVVLSGFWLPVVERFVATGGRAPARAAAGAGRPGVDLCHVDSCPSPSWRVHPPGTIAALARHVWLLDAEGATIPRTIPVTAEDPLPWSVREPRALCHGGGWGMGTYRDRGRELLDRGIDLDVVIHDPADSEALPRTGARLFLIDPDWAPWHDDGFPPFGELTPAGAVGYRRGRSHHESFGLARRASAIISKPGGGTLLDSLWSATPMVLLEPVGSHEAANAHLWERLGFGVGYHRWLEHGCSFELLRSLHRNLLVARSRIPSYVDALAGT
jgi:hypothetical protein